MKSINKIIVCFSVLVLAVGLFSCSDSESKLKPIPSGQTAVIINLNLPPENPTANDNSMWNKIKSFFIKDAIAQTAPATFSSISVTVTGSDMLPVQQAFLPTDTILVNVPAGNARQFAVLATVASGDPSAALSFSGAAASDLADGQTVSLPVTMLLNETKIVVADFQGNRLVTINDMSGANWNAQTALNGISLFNPNDVSFDSRGRIYLTNASTSGIVRADNTNGLNAIQFGPGSIGTLSVDRNNNILYYATSNALFKSNLNGSGQISLTNTSPALNPIRGIDVAANGMLFIVGSDASGFHYVTLYDPNANSGNGQTVSLLSSSTFPALNTPWDVISKPPYIYVANLSGAANNQILRFSLDASNNFIAQGNFGTQGNTTSQGVFYGARRFLAIRNDSLIVASCYNISSPGLANLVSFSDILGSNWTTFGSFAIVPGINQFKLWAAC